MDLPETVRVKLSSEAAGSISITPVVVRDMATRELVELMLGITGKDAGRVRELMMRGTLVSGASRFRWSGWDPGLPALQELLATFPDSDPRLPFSVERCVRAVFHGGRAIVDVPRDAGQRHRFLRRNSLWDRLMALVAAMPVEYVDYSYRDRADRYRLAISAELSQALRASASMAAYTTLASQLQECQFETLELFVERISERSV
jgi:hypothetical protein